jgi:hypothetical protein
MTRRQVVGVVLAVVTVVAVIVQVHGRPDRSHSRPRTVTARNAESATTGPRDEEAVKVALAYVWSSAELLARGPIGRRELLARLVTPGLVEAQLGSLDEDVQAIESRLRTDAGDAVAVSELRWVETPLRISVQEQSGGPVDVDVWSLAVFGAPSLGEVRAAWRTFHLSVSREGGSWLIDRADLEAGPTPADDGVVMEPSTFQDLEQVAGWQPAGRWAR